MKTLGSILLDYVGGLVIWILMILTLEIIIEVIINAFHADMMYPIAYGATALAFFILTPLGITYIARTIKETRQR